MDRQAESRVRVLSIQLMRSIPSSGICIAGFSETCKVRGNRLNLFSSLICSLFSRYICLLNETMLPRDSQTWMTMSMGDMMTPGQTASVYDLSGHIQFLGRIYTFLGWLGLIGSGFLLLSLFSPQAMSSAHVEAGLFGISPHFSVFLLICWSILLLNFAKDITGSRKWSTGIGGVLIASLSLLSVPVGTAVGIYTLWFLLQYRRLQ